MGKRTTFPDDEDASTRRKRQKLDDDALDATFEHIQSSNDLRQLLAFQQDTSPKLRQNIQSFKIFLDSITYGKDEENRSRGLSILLQYLRLTTPAEGDTTSIALADVIQNWSFASQSNHDGLLSAIPAVLALLLKTISSLIDFRDYGVQICKALLQKEQIKLFDRGLTANKSKEHLISPCLRLLTEITAFDGGSSARRIYVLRDITFKRLDIFLGMRIQAPTGTKREKLRPSVRNNALHFLLSNLKFQDHIAKADILSQSKTVRALFQGISEDPSHVVLEILDSLRRSVVLDDTLARKYKSKLLTDWALSQLAYLYEYPEDDAAHEKSLSIKNAVNSFLLYVCTTVDRGVLVEQHGWYPPGTEGFNTEYERIGSEFDSKRSEREPIYTEKVPVRNVTLANFLQGLRPYASPYHLNLMVAIFTAAPELVADYFLKKKNFSFEPRISATWIGYSAFLFSTVQLAPPTFMGDHPPPVTIVLESILPQPLSQKTLTRCLNQKIELVKFFAARLVVIAMQKLERVLTVWHGKHDPRWSSSSSRLLGGFCQRCPELKHAISAFRGLPGGHVIFSEALLRMISMYYEITPQLAMREKFDVSVPLTAALAHHIGEEHGLSSKGFQFLQLDHLLEIARRSPDMVWWHKSGKVPLSTFTTLLRLYASLSLPGGDIIYNLLRSLVIEHTILQQDTSQSALDAFVATLQCRSRETTDLDALYAFLDMCILRLVRKSVKYCGDVDDLVQGSSSTSGEKRPISLLTISLMEQWPFFVESASLLDLTDVCSWLAQYLDSSWQIGEDISILRAIRDRLWQAVESTNCGSCLEDALSKRPLPHKSLRSADARDELLHNDGKAINPGYQGSRVGVNFMLSILVPPVEGEDHPGLNRWANKDIAEAVVTGAVGDLLLCLCSNHEEIRIQALVNIRLLLAKLKVSDYSEWQQLYLLLEEVAESAKQIVSAHPFPYFGGVMATRSVQVLDDPLHFMYPKINKFLNKGPQWNVAKLPSYWIDKVFLHEPVEDDAHNREVDWVLDTLIDGLRTTAEMESYRKCNVFERVMSMATSPSVSLRCSEKILHLLYRCTFVDGSTTLITRCGVLSWIRVQVSLSGGRREQLKLLAGRLHETCDMDRVTEWSGGTIDSFVKLLANIIL